MPGTYSRCPALIRVRAYYSRLLFALIIRAYKVAAPLTGGNLGLQSGTGPPTKTLDFSLFKDFLITERFKLQFRTETFNLTNTPVFNIPDASLGNARALGGNGNFGRITSSVAGTERRIQFALRLSF